MEINVKIIQSHLEKQYAVSRNDANRETSLCSFRFYNGDKMKPNTLYILRASQLAYLDFFEKNCAFLVIGLSKQTIPNHFRSGADTPDILLIEEEVETTRLSNDLCDIFDTYNAWEAELLSCESSVAGLQKMIDCSDKRLHGSVIIPDVRFNYIAYSNSWAHEIDMIRSLYHGRTPDYIVEELLTDPEYIKVQNCRELFEYPIHTHDSLVKAYCLNIFSPKEEDYRARILFVPDSYPASETDLMLLKIMWNYMTHLYNEMSDYALPLISFQELRSAIRNGVQKAPISESLLTSTLRYVNWDIHDRYQLLVFTPYFFENTKEINGVTQNQIELLIPHSCTILYDKHIVALINLTKNLENQEDKTALDSSDIARFIREHLYKVGASAEFDDFTRLHQAYRESLIALQQGNLHDSTFWYYSFTDYSLQYMMDTCQREISRKHLCIPGLVMLRQYDDQHETEYVKTLRQYLDSKYNVTHAAEKLYLHRTTLLKHLKRIQEITGMDLDDWDTRLHLAMSIQMMYRP